MARATRALVSAYRAILVVSFARAAAVKTIAGVAGGFEEGVSTSKMQAHAFLSFEEFGDLDPFGHGEGARFGGAAQAPTFLNEGLEVLVGEGFGDLANPVMRFNEHFGDRVYEGVEVHGETSLQRTVYGCEVCLVYGGCMTTQSYHRCATCGNEYLYQGSGHGCNRPKNSSTWCPSCKGVVDAALSMVPRLFECRYRNVLEMEHFKHVTLEMIKVWETTPTSGIQVRRVWPGLFNLKTGDQMSIREVVGRDGAYPVKGARFRVSTWDNDPEYTIEVPMEYDLKNERFTGHQWP